MFFLSNTTTFSRKPSTVLLSCFYSPRHLVVTRADLEQTCTVERRWVSVPDGQRRDRESKSVVLVRKTVSNRSLAVRSVRVGYFVCIKSLKYAGLSVTNKCTSCPGLVASQEASAVTVGLLSGLQQLASTGASLISPLAIRLT